MISIGSYSENSNYNDQGIRAIHSDKTKTRVLNKEDLTMILNDKTASGRIIGRVLYIDKSGEYVYNQRTERIEINRELYNPKFIYHLLNAPEMRNKIIKQSQGNTQIFVNWNGIKNTEYLIPHLNEQARLEKIFANIDNLITLHQRKYSKKLQTWEQRKLFDVAEYRNGKAHENDIDEDGIYIVVNSKFVSTDGEVKKYSNKQNEPLLKNEIAFVLSDVPNGRAIAKTFLVEKSNKYTLNQRIAGITPHSDINPKFLSVTMNRNKYFLQFDDGVKQTNLSLDDMKQFEEFYPRKMEQDKIGEIFSNIDNLITLHQHQ